jgi:hypothetical protein
VVTFLHLVDGLSVSSCTDLGWTNAGWGTLATFEIFLICSTKLFKKLLNRCVDGMCIFKLFTVHFFLYRHFSFLAAYGDAAVCSESDLGLGQCSGNTLYAGAILFCSQKYRDRGRLCTISELMNDEAQDAPCGYETEDIWTSEPCGPTDVYVYDGTTTTCQNLFQPAKVRCCADQVCSDILNNTIPLSLLLLLLLLLLLW